MMKIGLIQASSCGDVTVNLTAIRQYAAQAAQKECSALCFPECFLTSYAPEEAAKLALSTENSYFEEISSIAAACSLDLLVGFMERENEAFFITHGLFRRDGSKAFYRKTHPGEREKQFFQPGTELNVLSLTDGTKIGISLCVENHYPEMIQTLSLKGAEIIFAPHASPKVSGERKKIWNKFIPARSYDNRVYMACCNLWDGERFGGGCLVTDPRGEVTAAEYGDAAALLVCEIDTSLTASFRSAQSKRSRHYYPALRRKELYE